MARIHKDAQGLYVKVGGYIARPERPQGDLSTAHMTDVETQHDEGEFVYARHIGGTKLVRIGRKPEQELWFTHEAYL